MTSRRPRIAGVALGIAQPRTKHEEIMLCIESTNDIVSKLLENAEEAKKRRTIAIDIIDKFVKFIEGKMKE